MSENQLATTGETALSVFLDGAKFEMLQRGAKLLASSTMVPKEYQGNASNCAIAINIADRLGADVFSIMQSMDVIYGRPSWRASFLIGMINASRRFTPLQFKIERGEMKTVTLTIPYWHNKQKKTKQVEHTYQDMSCTAVAKDSSGEVVEGPPVTMDMAIAEGWLSKDGSKWMTMQEVMIRYRAGAFFARLYTPDITLGMQTQEEMEDTGELRHLNPDFKKSSAPDREKPIVRDEPINPGAGATVAEKETVETPPVTEDLPKTEKVPAQGRQKKDRFESIVKLTDISQGQTDGGKDFWVCLFDNGKRVAEIVTFSTTHNEQLAGRIGSTLKIVYTQNQKDLTLHLDSFELIEANSNEGGLI